MILFLEDVRPYLKIYDIKNATGPHDSHERHMNVNFSGNCEDLTFIQIVLR